MSVGVAAPSCRRISLNQQIVANAVETCRLRDAKDRFSMDAKVNSASDLFEESTNWVRY